MTIKELYDKLKGYEGKQWSITGAVLPKGTIVDFCGKLAPAGAFAVDVDQSGVILSGDQQQVTVKGKTSSLGFGDFDITMVFSIYQGRFLATVTIDLLEKTLSLPGVDWISLGNPTIGFSVSNGPLPVTGSISTDVTLGVTVNLALSLPVVQDQWYFRGTFIPPQGIASIVELIGGVDISKYLQYPFKSIAADLQVRQVGFACNMKTKKLQYINAIISTPEDWQGWTIAPQVIVKNGYLSVTVDSNKDVSYDISGTLTVGDIDVLLSANHPGAKQGWVFNGQTAAGESISLTDLLSSLCKLWNVTLPQDFPRVSFQDLGFTLNTLVNVFSFRGTLDIENSQKFSLAGNSYMIEFNLYIESWSVKTGRQYRGYLKGIFMMGEVTFELEYDFSDADKLLKGSWSEQGGKTLGLSDIAKKFGSSDLVKILSAVPSSLDLALESASFAYDFTHSQLILTAASKNYGKAVFAAVKIKGSWVFVFAIAISDKTIDLSKLPLIGTDLEKIGDMSVKDFKLAVCSGRIEPADAATINNLIQAAGEGYPTLPAGKEGVNRGVNIAVTMELAGTEYTVQVGAGTKSTTNSTDTPKTGNLPAAVPSADAAPPAGGAAQNGYWINLQKSIGPVYFNKVGVQYQDNRLYFLFNVSLITSALQIDLDGLGVGSPLDKIDPEFKLDGLSISFTSGPVEISGGFLSTKVGSVTEYNGEALIKAAAFNLSALGSYATVDGHPSLFIFALLNEPPLGGPPAFFVTGVAAGFGYNRGLNIPSIDNVADFPLVSGFVPGKSSPFSGSDPGKALEVLVTDNDVPIDVGEDWLAAGLAFTSYEMIQSFALLVVEFGTKLEIALLGVSTASIPTGDPEPLVYAQLELEVRILPDDGIVAVDAKLSPASYLLTPACHLTGGFAFYLWFSPNEHKGDFVVTLGGYNPHFTPQPYYPKVPRLGFNWVVTPELSMKGGMYFALTPTCLMAGGSLEALWKSGNLKAWFNMGANFLIAWKPYHYQGDMYLSFGVSYTFKVNLLIGKITKTISVSLGADLSIWGPDFSGIAHIHLWIISFSISFGSASPNPSQTIPWDEFKNSFLPKPGTGSHDTALAADTRETADPTQTDSICSVKVTRGLIKDLSGGTDNPENINWMVNGEKATLETNSLIPSKKYQITIKGSDGVKVKKENMIYTNIDDLNARNQDFGVGLVGVENSAFHSHHDILIVYEDGHIDKDIQFDIFAILENVPKSLWEKRSPGYDSDAVIKNVLVGFDISPVVSPPDHSLPIEKKNLAFYWQTYTPPPAVTWPAPTPVPGPDQINPMKTMMETINTTAAAMRGDILQILVKNGIEVNTHVDVADIAAEGNDYLLAPPILSYTYWKHP